MTTTEPAAVLWDMDGTLVDTEPYWMAAETEIVESFGGTWTHDDALQLVGSGLFHSARVLQSHGVALGEQEIIDALTDRVLAQIDVSVPWRPGARELLEELAAANVPAALVTMSIRRMAERVAGALDFAPFRVIVAGDDVTHSKPHPEAYLRGAELLGVDAAQCIAIEDSAPGIASAVASGAVVIGIPLHVAVADTGDHIRWSTLAGRTVDDLRDAFADARSTGARA